jgi:hypothetical protein
MRNLSRHSVCQAFRGEDEMLDRQKIETILSRRFPGATLSQVAAAANAIMGIDDEWEEIPHDVADSMMADSPAVEVRLFRRREPSP